MNFVLLDSKVVCPSKLGKMSSSVAERGELGTLQGVPALGVWLANPLAIFQWGSAIGRALMAKPPRWGAPGSRFASWIRLFAPFLLVFGAFLEVSTSYRRDSFAFAKLFSIRS